jgi:biopolymer transport protein ExbB/TolQ
VSDASTSLVVMAWALVVMAVVQVSVLIAVAVMARKTVASLQQMQRDVQPLIEKAHRIADDAAKASALTLKQVERIDDLVTATSEQLDDMFGTVRSAIVEPLQKGTAIVAGFRAAMTVVRDWLQQRPRREVRDDEDGLFVG